VWHISEHRAEEHNRLDSVSERQVDHGGGKGSPQTGRFLPHQHVGSLVIAGLWPVKGDIWPVEEPGSIAGVLDEWPGQLKVKVLFRVDLGEHHVDALIQKSLGRRSGRVTRIVPAFERDNKQFARMAPSLILSRIG
jgi:hypothetical protein